jgi:hypothetical protein
MELVTLFLGLFVFNLIGCVLLAAKYDIRFWEWVIILDLSVSSFGLGLIVLHDDLKNQIEQKQQIMIDGQYYNVQPVLKNNLKNSENK